MGDKYVDEPLLNQEPIYSDEPPLLRASQQQKLSIIRIICMCGSVLSFQFMYSCSFALTAPLALDLKFSDSTSQLFSAFGPICGAIIQPIIGFWSDNVACKFGRRRPFIIAGQIGTGLGLIIQILVFQVIPDTDKNRPLRQGLYVIAILMFNVFVQAMQAPARTIIGDLVPKSQQVMANSIATQMIAIAAVSCNIAGFLLTKFPTNNSFMSLAVFIPFISLLFSVAGTVFTVVASPEQPAEKLGGTNPLKEAWHAIKNMDRPVIIAAIVLLCSWAAFYPFVFNATTYYAIDIFNSETGTDEYQIGVGYGMLMLAIHNLVVALSGFIIDPIIKKAGPKQIYFISQIVECAVLLGCVWMRGKKYLWISTALFALLGLSQSIFNIVPYAIVTLVVPKERMGMVMGALNIFVVAGQFISQTLVCPFIRKASFSEGKLGPVIAVGAPFAIISAISSLFIVIPEQEKSVTNASLIEGDDRGYEPVD